MHLSFSALHLKNREQRLVFNIMKRLSLSILPVLIVAVAAIPAKSQTCQMRDEIPDQVRSAIESTAQRTFDQASRGDSNSLRASLAPLEQANADSILSGVNDNKAAMEGAHPQLRTTFLLDTGANPSPDGRFYCGVFGANGLAANGAEFEIPGVPAGKYGVVIQDFIGNKGPYALTTIYQDSGGWKLAGFYVRPESAVGHDGIWYLKQARDFKSKGQKHNAWFYYLESWELMAPVRFMETTLLGNIVKESNSVQPTDVPVAGKPVSYSANGKTYSITDISVFPTDKSFDLSIKYSVPSTADFNSTVADARNLANAYVSQYPELRDAFNNVWAHAIDPNGGDVAGLVTLK
jgi:hypothetical protein